MSSHSLARIAIDTFPLFTDVCYRRTSAYAQVKPAFPQRVKFLHSPPSEKQCMVPGLYFAVPPTLSYSELYLLERSILKVLHEHPSSFDNAPLDVSRNGFADKFSDYDHPVFNTIRRDGDFLFLSSARCFIADPRIGYKLTSCTKPSYGTAVGFDTATALMTAVFAVLSSRGDEDLMRKDMAEISRVCGVRLRVDYEKRSFRINHVEISFAEEDDVQHLMGLLYDYFHTHNRVTDFLI